MHDGVVAEVVDKADSTVAVPVAYSFGVYWRVADAHPQGYLEVGGSYPSPHSRDGLVL